MKAPLLSNVKQTFILQQKPSCCYFQTLFTLYMSKLVVKIHLLTAGISVEKIPYSAVSIQDTMIFLPFQF